MTREEIKAFLETLYFHGYIDYDITKLDDLLQYYPAPDKIKLPLDVEI